LRRGVGERRKLGDGADRQVWAGRSLKDHRETAVLIPMDAWSLAHPWLYAAATSAVVFIVLALTGMLPIAALGGAAGCSMVAGSSMRRGRLRRAAERRVEGKLRSN
jgi:hypothetical protein